MTSIEKALGKMKRLWVLEKSARGILEIAVVGVLGVLVVMLAHRLGAAPSSFIIFFFGCGVCAAIGLVFATAVRTPSREQLARLLDERSNSRDLFASALEFAAKPDRFGWLGELTCQKALADAQRVALRPRLSLGSAKQWGMAGTIAGFLVAANIIVLVMLQHRAGGPVALPPRVATNVTNEAPPSSTKGTDDTAVAPVPSTMEVIPVAAPTTQGAETVQITNEMMQQFLASNAPQDVDMEGVTPIRWDAEESASAAKQQTQNPDEKVDPVKLDASLLKDLQAAKKTKEEGGGKKEGGVDIAVMGENSDGFKTKADGGKNKDGSLADAASKDPRGQPTRMGVRPPRKGLQILSWAKWPTRQHGDERPMTAMEFMAALDSLKKKPATPDVASPPVTAKAEDKIVRQEAMPADAASLAESYFSQLRKADR